MIDDRTTHLDLPLPNVKNLFTEDTGRLREALTALDVKAEDVDVVIAAMQATLADKADSADIGPAIDAAIDTLINGAPAALDTLKELADLLEDQEDAVAALVAAVALKANTADVYNKTYIDGKFATENAFNAGFLTTVSINTNAVAGDCLLVDTTGGAVTITLPASPASGNRIVIHRRGGSSVVISRNGKQIHGLAEDLTMDEDGQGVLLTYLNYKGTSQWRASPEAYE